MLTKTELLKRLEGALKEEEKSIPFLYEKCVACFAAIRDVDMIAEDKNKMRRLLYQLTSEARHHRDVLEALIARVRGSDRDEY